MKIIIPIIIFALTLPIFTLAIMIVTYKECLFSSSLASESTEN
jgi:hypothetical protein